MENDVQVSIRLDMVRCHVCNFLQACLSLLFCHRCFGTISDAERIEVVEND